MTNAILVLNSGSSSIKYCLYEWDSFNLIEREQISDIGGSPRLAVKDAVSTKDLLSAVSPGGADHAALTHWLLDRLSTKFPAVNIMGVGHRVVHGGLEYTAPTLMDDRSIEKLRTLTPLAPNHQPHNLAAIKAVSVKWPSVAQVACFDTAFHREQPRLAQLFALPRALTNEGVIRYGFHGLSYEYIAQSLPDYLGEKADGRIIVAHLGHGASMCAMKNRQSIATTMGFTTMDGLMMGKRCGALDPGVVLYLLEQKRMSVEDVRTLLSEQSGLKGVSGRSDNLKTLLEAQDQHSQEALNLFVYRASRELGSLVAALGGLDALIFTAGIGENSSEIRERICTSAGWTGIEVDLGENERHATRISKKTSTVDAFVIPTNEEIVIAHATKKIINA